MRTLRAAFVVATSVLLILLGAGCGGEEEPVEVTATAAAPTHTPTHTADAADAPAPTVTLRSTATSAAAPSTHTPAPDAADAPAPTVTLRSTATSVRSGQTPTSDAAAASQPTATLRSAPTSTSMATAAAATETAVPTATPTATAETYAAPGLLAPSDQAAISQPPVTLQWRWDGTLDANEHFDVRVWFGGQPPSGIAWSEQTSFTIGADHPIWQTGPGWYHWQIVVIESEDGQMERELSPASQEWVFQWAPTPTPSVGAIRGVVEAAGGPVAGAQVEARLAGLQAETNSAGEYVIDSVPPGEEFVTVEASALQSAFQPVVVRAGETATANFALRSGIPGGRLGMVQGRVVIDSRPAVGARVSIWDPRYPDRFTTTNNEGFYQLTGITGPQLILAELNGARGGVVVEIPREATVTAPDIVLSRR